MSALAWHYLQRGCVVSGYDRSRSPLTARLEQAGASIHYEEDPGRVPAGTDVVIYTPAVPESHAEWGVIRKLGVPVFKRAEILGAICQGYKTLAVAGTHGKTTVSSMLAYLLQQSIGCNAILGGISLNLGGNYHYDASSPFMVTEADEYDRSFWQLHPWFAAVTAWDPDHLDVYGTVGNMRDAYRRFMRQCRHFIAHGSLLEELRVSGRLEGAGPLPEADYFYGLETAGFGGELPPGEFRPLAEAAAVRVVDGAYRFHYQGPRGKIEDLELRCPGRHNVENAVAAVSLALEAGMDCSQVKALLPGFKGVARRLEKRAENGKCSYYDDYAHHPAEIEASLQALREFYPDACLRVAFQPHLYTRTRDLAEGFARALSCADEVFLVDIYPARELPIPGVDTRMIGDKIGAVPVSYGSRGQVLDWIGRCLAGNRGEPWVLVTMGAGDIDRIVPAAAGMIGKGGMP